MNSIRLKKEGTRLLKLFCEEQTTTGHIGCQCPKCEKNMQNAYKRFLHGES